MDHGVYEPFFLQPTDTWHRRYEALRSIFVERHPLSEVADRFGISHGTIRNWVSAFRTQYDRGQPPPFSSNRRAGVLRAATAAHRPISSRSKSRTSQGCP
jgi:transposase-like protein